MTLYYPNGLYGPICDIQPTVEVEPIVREVIIQEPKINTNTVDVNTTGGTGGNTAENIVSKLIPKICKTVNITNLYGGPFGPICDLSSAPGNNINPLVICNEEPPEIPLRYNPLSTLPPEFSLDVPSLECQSKTIELPTVNGIETIVYYYNCKPSIGNYTGPNPEDYGIDTKKKKITYTYSHSLVCGGMDYYSSPGRYTQSIPPGITTMTIFAIGAGGGAGGLDAAVGNNSGGTGSFMYVTLTLDPSIRNELEYVVGGGGLPGMGWHNRAENTLPGYNRGGIGGHPGPQGVSGAGGGAGGATDVYLNGRLILSVGGGGGGGGQGCNWFLAQSGKPYANWNNYTYNNNPTISSDALKVSRFSPLMAVPVFAPAIKHSLWSNWFKTYVVWFNTGESTLPGVQLENRINLEFPVAGTYTIEFEGDNQLALYIAPWYDTGETGYVTDNLYNGSTIAIRNLTNGNNIIPVDSNGVLLPPSTLPAEISGASAWQFLGYTINFTSNTPTSVTYTVTTPGRYVLRTFLENAFGDATKLDWLYNPGGMAIVIKKPDGSILWTTRSAFGSAGQNKSGDGPGGGGGGGNEGRSGLNGGGGITGGSCSNADSTAQGGSAGWSYVLNHPAVNVEFFGQAPSGMVNGWNTPTGADSSVRRGGGGFGSGRPNTMSIVYNGETYDLFKTNGSFKTVLIPGMGTGVWEDFMSGKSFQYHYYWGVTSDNDPSTTIPELVDSGESYGKILLGAYEGARNCTAANRPLLSRARSLELALQWTPIKTGANTWDTQVRLVGIPPWGEGAGWRAGDILPGVMPPSESQGTQPWWDILHWNDNGWHVLEFYDAVTKTVKKATKPNTSFSFSIQIDTVGSGNKLRPTDGRPGFVRSQFYSTNYTLTED